MSRAIKRDAHSKAGSKPLAGQPPGLDARACGGWREAIGRPDSSQKALLPQLNRLAPVAGVQRPGLKIEEASRLCGRRRSHGTP